MDAGGMYGGVVIVVVVCGVVVRLCLLLVFALSRPSPPPTITSRHVTSRHVIFYSFPFPFPSPLLPFLQTNRLGHGLGDRQLRVMVSATGKAVYSGPVRVADDV